MDVIVIDFKSIYIVHLNGNTVSDDITDDVLAAYMKESGEGWKNMFGESYTYWTTTHSNQLYSIRRKIKEDDNSLKHSAPYLSFIVTELDIAHWWALAYPIIEQIANVTGALTGVVAVASVPVLFIKWVRAKASANKEKGELDWVRLILAKDGWNISLLSQEISVTEDEAKKLLKGLGYIWDSQKMLYIASESTQKLRDLKPRQV